MNAREWTETITSSPTMVSVLDGISENAAQALCEAIEQEIAPLVAQHNNLLAALKRSEALLNHLMKNVPWGKTSNVDFGELNAVLCMLPGVIARAEGKS